MSAREVFLAWGVLAVAWFGLLLYALRRAVQECDRTAD